MEKSPRDKTMIVAGVLSMLVGATPLLAMSGILPQAQHAPADPAPSWMGWIIGFMFMSAGAIVIARGIWGSGNPNDDELPATAPWQLRALNDTLAVGIVFGLAAVFTWVAFGPGPRHFSVGLGGLFFAGSHSGDTIGRVAFGFGAVLGWIIAALVARATLRRWRR